MGYRRVPVFSQPHSLLLQPSGLHPHANQFDWCFLIWHPLPPFALEVSLSQLHVFSVYRTYVWSGVGIVSPWKPGLSPFTDLVYLESRFVTKPSLLVFVDGTSKESPPLPRSMHSTKFLNMRQPWYVPYTFWLWCSLLTSSKNGKQLGWLCSVICHGLQVYVKFHHSLKRCLSPLEDSRNGGTRG